MAVRSLGKGALRANLLTGARYFFQEVGRNSAQRTWRALRLLMSLRRHFRVLRVLSHPQSAEFLRRHPRVAFKYLAPYVVRRLRIGKRRSIFAFHFEFLQKTFNNAFINWVESSSPTLWRQVIADRTFRVAIQLADVCEGEVRLAFYMDRWEVYRLNFVFAAGQNFALPDEVILVVGCIQGAPDYQRVKSATKLCCDIQPAHILMAALGGIAQAARVAKIIGPHETRHLFAERVLFSYGRFFETYGQRIPGQDMYGIPVPYIEKPTSEIQATHRRRNRKKRRFRSEVSAQTMRALRGYLVTPAN